MSFGRNPHVAKAQAAEQKAELANDRLARERAYREAAHLWERAASREQPGKRKVEYEASAERLRALADEPTATQREEPPTERARFAPSAFVN